MSQNLAEVYPKKSAKTAERKKTREQFAVCNKAVGNFALSSWIPRERVEVMPVTSCNE